MGCQESKEGNYPFASNDQEWRCMFFDPNNKKKEKTSNRNSVLPHSSSGEKKKRTRKLKQTNKTYLIYPSANYQIKRLTDKISILRKSCAASKSEVAKLTDELQTVSRKKDGSPSSVTLADDHILDNYRAENLSVHHMNNRLSYENFVIKEENNSLKCLLGIVQREYELKQQEIAMLQMNPSTPVDDISRMVQHLAFTTPGESTPVQAESLHTSYDLRDRELIYETVQMYLDGLYTHDIEKLSTVFHPGTMITLWYTSYHSFYTPSFSLSR